MIIHSGYDAEEMQEFKDSLFVVLKKSAATPQEIDFIIAAIDAGRIDGEYYFSADKKCGCLLGTLSLARRDDIVWEHTSSSDYEHCFMDEANVFNRSWTTILFERYIINVEYGQTHLTSNELANTREWLLEYKESLK